MSFIRRPSNELLTRIVLKLFMMSRTTSLLLAAAVVVGLGLPAAVAAFSPQLATTSPQVTQISIPNGSGLTQSSRAFTPNSVTVVIGVNNTVTWTDNDNQMDANGYTPNHTVTANDNSFTSQSLSYGDTYTYTFTTAGSFAYHCNVHSWMAGTVIVKGTTTPAPEFPLPYVVLLITLGVTAVAFTLAKRGSSALLTPTAP
jgi:plastocyanin